MTLTIPSSLDPCLRRRVEDAQRGKLALAAQLRDAREALARAESRLEDAAMRLPHDSIIEFRGDAVTRASIALYEARLNESCDRARRALLEAKAEIVRIADGEGDA